MTHIHQDITTTNFMDNIADKDNPLIDRFGQDEWLMMRKQAVTGANQSVFFTASLFQTPPKSISFTKYNIADFSEISMHEVMEEQDVAIQNIITEPSVINESDIVAPMSTVIPTAPQTVKMVQTIESDVAVLTPETQKKPKNQVLSKSAKRQLAKQQKQRLAEELAEKQAEEERLRQEKIAYALANPTIHENLLNQRKSMIDSKEKVKDIFSELEQDLQEPLLPESLSLSAKQAYQQAIAILQTPQNQAHTQKALAIIDKLAKAQISDAILQQALWHLRGRAELGIVKNEQQGLALLMQSAKLQDNRAEKLLSKLYFSGEIVKQDTEQAKYWLEQSAEHGHKEALKLQQGLLTAHTLQQNRVADDDYLKKLGLGVVAMVIFAFVVIFLVKI